MSAVAEHLKKTKATLARSLAKVESEAKSIANLETQRKQTFSRYFGAGVTSTATAGMLGVFESRFLIGKNGLPMLGVVPLSAIAAPALVAGAAVSKNPLLKDQLAYAGAGCFGAAASHFGRIAGLAWKAKSAKKKRKGKGKGRKKTAANKLPTPNAVVEGLAPYDAYAQGDYGEDDYDGDNYGAAYDDDAYDSVDVDAYDVGELEDDWTPEERELLGVA